MTHLFNNCDTGFPMHLIRKTLYHTLHSLLFKMCISSNVSCASVRSR